jgi:Kef-type K+ transport system membrane component KefB
MEIFTQLSILIVIAALMAGLMRLLKQPLIMGHIITGIIVGPHLLGLYKDGPSMEIFSVLGISILLFIVGLNLSPNVLKEVGRVSFFAGLGQVALTVLLGLLLSRAFGYNLTTALYIGFAVSFSSTIIALKLMSDKKDLEKLYSRISVGILLTQDVVAIVAMTVLATFSSSQNASSLILLTLIKGLALVEALSLISYYILPRLSNFFAKSQEYLFLFAIAWGFGFAALFNFAGFSVEIGALVAGISLSMSPFAAEISSKLKPLRDFFLILFFIILGSSMSIENLGAIGVQALLLSSAALLFKPFIVAVFMGMSGYNRKTAFMTGITTPQLSEFSLILVMMGIKLGHISSDVASLVTLTLLITIAVSTYLILNAEKIYPIFAPYLKFLEIKKPLAEIDSPAAYDVILFGCNRVGYDFLKVFRYLGKSFLAVDFDPDIIAELRAKKINCRYGDAEDSDFLDEINVCATKLVISTIPDHETNTFLLSKIRENNNDTIAILISYNVDEALELYDLGATYVVLPHFISGQFAAELARDAGFDIKNLHAKRSEHMAYLRERKALGHAHPAPVL